MTDCAVPKECSVDNGTHTPSVSDTDKLPQVNPRHTYIGSLHMVHYNCLSPMCRVEQQSVPEYVLTGANGELYFGTDGIPAVILDIHIHEHHIHVSPVNKICADSYMPVAAVQQCTAESVAPEAGAMVPGDFTSSRPLTLTHKLFCHFWP